MSPLSYDLPYNIYILFFGVYITMKTALGSFRPRDQRLYFAACPFLLLLQGAVMLLLNTDAVRLFYPLITHLPLIALLCLFAGVRWDIALVSTAVSYSLCQLPRWLGLLLSTLPLPPAAFVLIHIAASHLLLWLLDRFCLPAVHQVTCSGRRLLACMGAMPMLYYLYDYFLLYTSSRYTYLRFLSELLPTGLVLFFVLFTIVYRQETHRRTQAEQQMNTLQLRLHQAGQEMDALRAIQEQTAIFRHDMHHHLAMISGFLSAGKADAALQYISETRQQIDAIVPVRLCEHEAVNLLLCAYQDKAKQLNIAFHTRAELPKSLALSDTELIAMLSNGLENAVNAAKALPPDADRRIDVLCCLRQGNLLLEIRNPCPHAVVMKDGLPVCASGGMHYGCRSIQSITEQHHGICSFTQEGGVFTLRIAIPLA